MSFPSLPSCWSFHEPAEFPEQLEFSRAYRIFRGAEAPHSPYNTPNSDPDKSTRAPVTCIFARKDSETGKRLEPPEKRTEPQRPKNGDHGGGGADAGQGSTQGAEWHHECGHSGNQENVRLSSLAHAAAYGSGGRPSAQVWLEISVNFGMASIHACVSFFCVSP